MLVTYVPVRSFGPSRLAIVCASVTLLPRTDVFAAHTSLFQHVGEAEEFLGGIAWDIQEA